IFFFFSCRRRHTSFSRDWSSDVCSSDLRLWDRLFGRFFRAFNRVFELTTERYGGAVGRLVRRPALALTTYALLLGLIVVGFRTRSEERRVGKDGRSRWWAGAYGNRNS